MTQAVPEELWEAVERAQRGERDALGTLVDRLYSQVYRYAYLRLGSVADAEEATQETFTQMIRSIKQVKKKDASFEAWLFRLARNVVADEQRRRYRRREDVQAEMPEIGGVPSAEDDAVRRAEGEHLRLMLQGLPEEQRRVLELRFGASLSSEDVGRVLGKSAGAVRIQQMRALQALRSVMEVAR